MIFTNFPITGQFRFISMIFEWLFSIICLESGILFMFRHNKEHYKFKYSQDIGYIILFFAFFLGSIFSVLGSYFTYEIIVIDLYHLGSHIFLYSGFLLFIFLKEKQRVFLFKKYTFSIILVILLIIFIFFYFLDTQLIIIEYIVFLSLIYLFFILFFIKFIKKTKSESGVYIKYITTFFPFLLLLIGLFLTSDYSMYLIQIQLRLTGSLLRLSGIAFFSLFFLKYPTLSEFDWKDKIEEVFLINTNGACLFYKSYIQKEGLLNEHLITSAITSVNLMINQILKSGSKEISIIKKKGKIIYLFPSDIVTGVIFSKIESKTIELYMKKLVLRIGQVYKNILNNWNGDLEIFRPIDFIFEEIFSK